MSRAIAGPEIERLIQLLAKLPGLGPRSARRAALHLVKKREQLLGPLAEAMSVARERIVVCARCGNVDTRDPCGLCTDPRRDDSLIVVVADISDLWALERSGRSLAVIMCWAACSRRSTACAPNISRSTRWWRAPPIRP